MKVRIEHDLPGEREVPADAWSGIQTLRAVENFPITGVPISHFPHFVAALIMVKAAATHANRDLGLIALHKANAITAACDEVLPGGCTKSSWSTSSRAGPVPPLI